MKADRPSRTAHFVALGRALAHLGLSHVPNFQDPTARVFMNARGKKAVAKAEKGRESGKRGARVEWARGAADLMALRTSAIDDAVRSAVAAGTRQLVILGAGYDGRAWRLAELQGVKVFEVDHPATQNEKRARLAELPPAIGIVSFVPVNFERDSLSAALEHAGHDRSAKTCWIWEGVTMYLTRDAMRATLKAISDCSAPGSTVIVKYHTVKRSLFQRLIFHLIGEPHISAWTPDEMAADLGAEGFTVREDSGMTDWNTRFANGEAQRVTQRAFYMRIAVAGK